MAKSFTITTAATDTLKTDNTGRTQVLFTVTNTTSRPVRGLARVKALGSTEREWLKIAGETERDFGGGATEQFTVNFGPDDPGGSAPTAAAGGRPASATPTGPSLPPGKYPFRLDIASAQNPDEDTTEGPTVTVEVAGAGPVVADTGKRSKMWIIPVVIVAVLLIGGLLTWLLWPKPAPEAYQLPDVASASQDEARQRLETECKKGSECVSVATTEVADPAVAKGLALRTEPVAGTTVELGSPVTLFVSSGPGEAPAAEKIKLPDLANMTEDRARQTLDAACKTPPCVQLDTSRVVDSKVPAGIVVRTEPAAGTEVEIGSKLALFVSGGAGRVTILNVANQPIDRAKDMLEKSCQPAPCLAVGTARIADSKIPEGRVARTEPVAGTQVATGSRVTMFVSTGAPAPNTALIEAACFNAVQGQIAWNYQGTKTWAANNVRDLCRGTTNAREPAQCFQRVMHGGINWGGGTRWQWENARDLCAGSSDSNRTISCFQARIRGSSWQEAIRACKSK